MASILLAEDDDSLRRFLSAALERAGHVVTACGDEVAATIGRSALALGSGYPPMAPEMLQKTFCTWLPTIIRTAITTTAMSTRMSAYSTML